MRGRRVLNEHHFEGVVVPTYPRHQNIFQNFQVLRCVDFKARFDEMRRNHLTITCNGCKNHHRSWIFALHHRRNFWRIEGNYPSVLFICNLINNELFLVDKRRTCPPLCFRWFKSFGHLSALRALERVVRRLRTLLTYDFISRSSLTALLIVLRLTLRFCASFDIGWLGSDFNVLFSPARNVLVLFVSTSLNLTFGIKSSNNLINSRFRIASALNNVWNRAPGASQFTYSRCSG